MWASASTNLLVRVTRRLFIALIIPFVVVLTIAAFVPDSRWVVPLIVIASGLIGGFVGLQRRLKDLTVSDLQLIADSWIYTWLSPLVGAVLALLLYVLFLSELLSGQLFPHFVADGIAQKATGFASVFQQHGETYKDYAKLVFWCFVAGFSERFVTDIISRFEGTAVKSLPQASGADTAADQPGIPGRRTGTAEIPPP
ncbi:MAG: hypothetical protein ACREQO_08205 [Candidatus Binatia bacterium]